MNIQEQKVFLQEHVPCLGDLTNLKCYDEIELEVCKHLKELDSDEWGIVLSSNFNDLFQNGIPHISWNTDRRLIARQLERSYEELTSTSWDETWVKCTKRWYEVLPGLIISVKWEEPHLLSGGSTRCFVRIEKDVPEVYTHSAAIIGLNKDGRFFIKEQISGTEGRCKEWVTKTLQDLGTTDTKYTFEIMKR